MPRKASGKTRIDRIERTRKNGDVYVYEVASRYNPEKKYNEQVSSKLLGKIPAGETEMVAEEYENASMEDQEEMLDNMKFAVGKIGEIAKKVEALFDLRPKAIEQRLKLRAPIYEETAAYGHMGRTPRVVVKHFENRYEGPKDVEVELFTWEKLDAVDEVKRAFGL